MRSTFEIAWEDALQNNIEIMQTWDSNPGLELCQSLCLPSVPINAFYIYQTNKYYKRKWINAWKRAQIFKQANHLMPRLHLLHAFLKTKTYGNGFYGVLLGRFTKNSDQLISKHKLGARVNSSSSPCAEYNDGTVVVQFCFGWKPLIQQPANPRKLTW